MANPSIPERIPKEYCVFRGKNAYPQNPEQFALDSSTSGVFTTFRTYRIEGETVSETAGETLAPGSGTRHGIIGFAHHLERLLDNAQLAACLSAGKATHRRFLEQELPARLSGYLASLGGSFEARARIVIRQTGEFEFFFEPYIPPWPLQTPIPVRTFEAKRPTPEIKSTDLNISRAARIWCETQNAQEALLLDNNMLREGAWSNVFWTDSLGTLHTPASGLLPGVTRKLILELEPCILQDISVQEFLFSAVEVFVTQSTSGVTPVTSINGRALPNECPGRRTKEIMKRYAECVQQESLIL